MLHGDLYVDMILMASFSILSRQGGWVLGSHSFLSYLWSAEPFMKGWKIFRYERRRECSALETILEFLDRDDVGTFRIATDGGGPYGVVRASLVEMSIRSGRPLVALRARSSRSVRVFKHFLPLPFSKLEARFSRPVQPAELGSLSREAGPELLQKLADELGPGD
jgi:lysophospholipid acyltransferase (LPLAT)-like uncharacterized protein